MYTAGPGAPPDMPIHAGCTVCHADDDNLLDCAATGVPGSDDGPGWDSDCGTAGHAAIEDQCYGGGHDADQGAICFTHEEFVNWGQISELVQPCSERNIENDPSMALTFGCIEFASVYCRFDISGSDGSYDGALAEFTACMDREMDAPEINDPSNPRYMHADGSNQPPGYCSASLASAQFLRNEDVCVQPTEGECSQGDCGGPQNSNIGFHITIPFKCHNAGIYHFRMHADYGLGSFIGVDGAQHSPGNIWGHIMHGDVQLNGTPDRPGDHSFEALVSCGFGLSHRAVPDVRLGRQGFEDCCDGHAELEVHLPCDFPDSPWRTVHSGSHTWMSSTCLAMPPTSCPAPAECSMDTDSAANCGGVGDSVTCGAAAAAGGGGGGGGGGLTHGQARLSSSPQGRIEVWNENINSW